MSVSYVTPLDLAVVVVIVTAALTLWRQSLVASLKALSLQGVGLGAVAVVLGAHRHDLVLVFVGVLVLVIKGAAVPLLISRVLEQGQPGREAAPLINIPASLVGAGLLTLLAFGATRGLVNLIATPAARLIPFGIATMLIGFFAMVVRRRAVSQIVGLLTIDNGIALTAFLATSGVPLVVELGVTLDVLLGVAVLRVLAGHLHRQFHIQDLDQLRDLHD